MRQYPLAIYQYLLNSALRYPQPYEAQRVSETGPLLTQDFHLVRSISPSRKVDDIHDCRSNPWPIFIASACLNVYATFFKCLSRHDSCLTLTGRAC